MKTFCYSGYSIFVVRGIFPDCESDQMLTLLPVDPTKVKSTSTRGKSKNFENNKIPEPKQGTKCFNHHVVRHVQDCLVKRDQCLHESNVLIYKSKNLSSILLNFGMKKFEFKVVKERGNGLG